MSGIVAADLPGIGASFCPTSGSIATSLGPVFFPFLISLDFREREERRRVVEEEEREKHQFVVPLIDAFIG